MDVPDLKGMPPLKPDGILISNKERKNPVFCLAMFLQLPSASFVPRFYNLGFLGHWSGHLPFARDLIAELQPSVIVELGTQYGESYFGF